MEDGEAGRKGVRLKEGFCPCGRETRRIATFDMSAGRSPDLVGSMEGLGVSVTINSKEPIDCAALRSKLREPWR